MQIDLLSFFFGVLLALAGIIVVDKTIGSIWGNKKIRELQREVRRLNAVVKKKDEMIAKSLREMKKVELKDGP
jgi:CO dehydrogenase nickel-insertion accessory protein CooC1